MTKNITFDLADTVEMKKPHACQTNNWEVLRLGADIRSAEEPEESPAANVG